MEMLLGREVIFYNFLWKPLILKDVCCVASARFIKGVFENDFSLPWE